MFPATSINSDPTTLTRSRKKADQVKSFKNNKPLGGLTNGFTDSLSNCHKLEWTQS